LRRGGPPMVEGEMPSWNDGRTRGAGERGGRERRDGGREEREARKRRGEDVVHGDAKRPRRSGA
jgi:THO complex subunit 2